MDPIDESMPDSMRRKVAQYSDKCYTDVFIQNSFDQTFEKLPDTISIALKFQRSLTCHKIQDAARKHFDLKRQCGSVNIDTRLGHPHIKFKN